MDRRAKIFNHQIAKEAGENDFNFPCQGSVFIHMVQNTVEQSGPNRQRPQKVDIPWGKKVIGDHMRGDCPITPFITQLGK
jgi:hypothetical protein